MGQAWNCAGTRACNTIQYPGILCCYFLLYNYNDAAIRPKGIGHKGTVTIPDILSAY